ncbi:gamma-tubulin complex component 5 [Anopheles ziemanni]|uniref:gamma-tubulin complex component 5 n=1 Tax=Anopheles coustani TaxID=139045 RepID=UPI002657AC61|nr:gamma-tubulin complex component 5 [Anopheles coustani]XP_058174708.1 gamma-tubulin complex component 5 [Anopheles ziemanni]
MSLVLTELEALVQQYVPQLIKLLTEFDETEENYSLCHKFTLGIIRNHRFLSVNSHETRRNIESVIENMELSNFAAEARQLRKSYEDFITDPLCLNHYVHEIHWSVLLFLLGVAYNPLGALKARLRNGEVLQLVTPEPTLVPWYDKERDDLIAELFEENFAVGFNDGDQGSELSDWSDLEDDERGEYVNIEQKDSVVETMEVGSQLIGDGKQEVVVHSKVAPPRQEETYRTFSSANAYEWLEENLQNRWWGDSYYQTVVNSEHKVASFCNFWTECIVKASHGFLKSEPISTVSEYCVLREILWMFTNPVDCKFFRIDDDQIWINSNVSLPSTTEHGIHTFLLNFTECMTIAYRLRNFCSNILEQTAKTLPAPHSFECYAAGVKSFLNHMDTVMIAKERELIRQEPGKTHTIITFFNELEPELFVLKKLYDIHKFSVLDWTKFPAHIAVAHLLSGLFRSVKLSANLEKGNLAFALLLATLKCYMNMIDTWWTEGRLDDWREEFLVEKACSENLPVGLLTGYQARLFSKCKIRSFYVSSAISDVIENDPIIKLLLHHSLEAGYTLNILNGLDRISDMRKEQNMEENLVYQSFLEAILEELETFRTEVDTVTEETFNIDRQYSLDAEQENENIAMCNLKKQIREICDDDLLLLAFNSTLILASSENVGDETEAVASSIASNTTGRKVTNAFSLYTILNSISTLQLPLENVLFNAIKNLMETKRQAANHYVTYIYKEEFHVMDHLKNIRKVLLLEASDLMDYFYSSLFRRIEAGESWANPYLLTIQLNDILASRFTDMNTLFTVEVDRSAIYQLDTTSVLLAIDEIRILYNPGHDLSNMVNEETMASYNSVFRFLLKVKWALGTLETLRFPDSQKKRPPYTTFGMLDLILKRLAMLKFWMIFSVQCIHSHLMTHVLQSFGEQLDEKLNQADNLSEMIAVHQSYISTIFEHCFQQDDSKQLMEGIIRLLNLVYIMRDEWLNTVLYSEMDARGDIEDNGTITDFITNSQVDELERTYCTCHQQLAKLLSREAYGKHKLHLTGLADAFSYNVPY